MTLNEQLEAIRPGKTYPSYVKVVEGDGTILEFHLNSFYVGMYCAIHVNGKVVMQTGDRNNKTLCTKLKKDLKGAIERKCTVEVGAIRECQLEMPLA